MTKVREELMVPKADFGTYYGRPILKEPTWKAADIAGYFFAGGLAGGSSLLAAAADLSGSTALRRAARFGAVGGLGFSLAALVHDLGRPGRFLNMLRVAKPTSPMSMGSWLLTAYAPLAALAAGTEIVRPPAGSWVGRAAGLGAAGLGAGVATYTSVLIADTAVPSWHDGYRVLPVLFAGSSAASAGGLGLLTSPSCQAGGARLFGVAGAVTELVAAHRIEHAERLSAEPYRSGRAGRLMTAARIATAIGAVGSAAVARRSRTAAILSGAALMAGSALTRFGVFEAGVASTRDPKYVVVPQRGRDGDR